MQAREGALPGGAAGQGTGSRASYAFPFALGPMSYLLATLLRTSAFSFAEPNCDTRASAFRACALSSIGYFLPATAKSFPGSFLRCFALNSAIHTPIHLLSPPTAGMLVSYWLRHSGSASLRPSSSRTPSAKYLQASAAWLAQSCTGWDLQVCAASFHSLR